MSTPRPWAKPLTAAVAALVTLASVLPAQASPPTVVYDALGDSFAAGLGAPEGYPTLIDGRMRIMLDDNVAVSGARLASLGAQLKEVGPETRLVTLSVGGNDVGWAEVVFLCAAHPDPTACPGVAFETNAAIAAAATAVGQAYGAVALAAPNAHVVVTGYPRLFSPEYGDLAGILEIPGFSVPFELTVEEQMLLNDLADQLNSVLKDQAEATGFQFVDVTKRFDGHGVNSDDPWITGVDSEVPLHPNANGQRAYAAALTSSINPGSFR